MIYFHLQIPFPKINLFIAMASAGSRESVGPRRIFSEIIGRLWVICTLLTTVCWTEREREK